MDSTSKTSVSFMVDGKEVAEGELNLVIKRSLDHIKKLTDDLKPIKEKIENAIKDAKVLTGESVENYSGDKKDITKLAPVERRRIWSFGIKVIDDEQSFGELKKMLKSTAEVLKDVAGAQYDADMILSEVLEYQRELAREMKFLYGLAAVNAHQCDWVAKSITLRIKKAGRGELNEEEIECLNNVLQDIKTKREFFALNMTNEAHEKALEDQRKKDSEHDAELKRQREKDDTHDAELKRQREKDDVHDHRLDELTKRIVQLEKNQIPLWVKLAIAINLLLSIVALVCFAAK